MDVPYGDDQISIVVVVVISFAIESNFTLWITSVTIGLTVQTKKQNYNLPIHSFHGKFD